MAHDNHVAEPQGDVALVGRLAVVPVTYVGGLVEVEDDPGQVAREEHDHEPHEDHRQPVLCQAVDPPS